MEMWFVFNWLKKTITFPIVFSKFWIFIDYLRGLIRNYTSSTYPSFFQVIKDFCSPGIREKSNEKKISRKKASKVSSFRSKCTTSSFHSPNHEFHDLQCEPIEIYFVHEGITLLENAIKKNWFFNCLVPLKLCKSFQIATRITRFSKSITFIYTG